MGHSCGTMLSWLYTQKHPEQVKVVVSISQVVNILEGNKRIADRALQKASANPKDKTAEKLKGYLESVMGAKSMDEMNIKEYAYLKILSQKYFPYRSAFSVDKFVGIEKFLMEDCFYRFDFRKGEAKSPMSFR